MALPFLPGNSFNQRLGKNKFHKSHHFDIDNKIAMLVGAETKPGIGGDPLRGQRLKPTNSTYPCGAGSKLPAWVAFDRQVLCFDAYFQEAVDEKREEQFRIRNCKIYFYLEDDSIQVIEPRIKNTGIPQGTLIRRHRIPRSPPNDEEYFNVEDFNVGQEICLYSRVFKLTGCDEFTQNFLCKLGVRVNQPDGAPIDPYMGYRKALDESLQPLRPYEKHDTLKQFLDHDRHVLRFYCFWDDSDNTFGEPREMVLHYFLADDTIEIRECIPANSGRDAAPMFLRRTKLPKDIMPLNQPGVATDRTVLNVFGTGHGGRYLLDALKTGAIHNDYYTDSDLTLGSCLNVWGRKFILCDCDTFTQEYYKTKYGIEDFTPVRYKSQDTSTASKQLPPYNGFGSEEDSLCSCISFHPKPPRRDFIKFLEKDRSGLDSNVLRYLAKMETTKPIDADRRFIISYFLSDDMILIFEPRVRNSGIIGGKFLERSRVKKPMQQRFSTDFSEYYSASDLFVGATVDFNSHRFNIIDADEYAFRYMEKCAAEFPKANIQCILQTLASLAGQKKDEIRSFFMRNDPNGTDILQYEQFHNLIKQLAPQLTEHEIMTIARYYGDNAEQDAQMDIKTLISIVQEQLRKNNFEGFVKLSENFQQIDSSRCGRLDADTVRKVCHALHVPIADDMLRALLIKMVSNEQGHIDYESLIKNLNWIDCPVAPMSAQGVRFDEGWAGNKAQDQISKVRYQVLLDDILGKSEQVA